MSAENNTPGSIWQWARFWSPGLVYGLWRVTLLAEDVPSIDRLLTLIWSAVLAQSVLCILYGLAFLPVAWLDGNDSPSDLNWTAPSTLAALFSGVGLLIWTDVDQRDTRLYVADCVAETVQESAGVPLSDVVTMCFKSEGDDVQEREYAL